MSKIKSASALFLISVIFLSGCSSEKKRNALIQNAKTLALKNFTASLSNEEKISQLFLVNIQGNETFIPIEKMSLLNENASSDDYLVPGGCLLFKYNIGKTKDDVQKFISSIRGYYSKNGKVPPYIAVDQEGGYVNRLRGITDAFPSQKKIACEYSVQEAESLYENQSAQMRELGFNMNLAPVVEVETEMNKDFLDTRSFGALESVIEYGGLEIEIFEKNKVASVLKHFPGNSNTDPHTGLPEIKATREELENTYIKPFRELLKKSSAVLMSHARFYITDETPLELSVLPCCLSKYWATDVIRNELEFDGLILSDDIFMAALEKNGFPPETACVMAFEAGVDVLMLSEKRFADVAKLLLNKCAESAEFSKRIENAVENVIKYKISAGLLKYVETKTDGKTPSFELKPAY